MIEPSGLKPPALILQRSYNRTLSPGFLRRFRVRASDRVTVYTSTRGRVIVVPSYKTPYSVLFISPWPILLSILPFRKVGITRMVGLTSWAQVSLSSVPTFNDMVDTT